MSPWALGAAAGLAALALAGWWLLTGPSQVLRVLMYHRVGDHPGRDTVGARELERQIGWLRARGYSLVRLSEVLAHRTRGRKLPPRPVLLTFDDGTRDHFDELLPILRRQQAPAALFVVPSFVGRELDYHGRPTPFLDLGQLRALCAEGAELGLHSFRHQNLAELSLPEVEEELARSFAFFAAHGLPAQPVLAYPFGAYPRRDPAAREAFFAALRRAGVAQAYRIGNRLNRLPLGGDYEIQRIGVRRADGPLAFAVKVRCGRWKPFA